MGKSLVTMKIFISLRFIFNIDLIPNVGGPLFGPFS